MTAWEDKYQRLVAFSKRHGHTNVPKNHPLASWVDNQRRSVEWMHAEHVDKLLELNFVWNPEQEEREWQEMFKKIKTYKKEHKTLTSISDPELRIWAKEQSQKKHSEPRRKKLQALGLKFSSGRNREEWMCFYRLLQCYKLKYGDCHVNSTTDKQLVQWVRKQRLKKDMGKLSTAKCRALDAIEFCWNNREVSTVSPKKTKQKKRPISPVPFSLSPAIKAKEKSSEKNRKFPAGTDLSGLDPDYPVGAKVRMVRVHVCLLHFSQVF